MANVHYRLRGKQDNETIYLQLTIDRENRFEKRTGLHIDYRDWSKETKYPKQNLAKNKKLNITLRKLEAHILECANESYTKGIRINSDWLENQLQIFFGHVNPAGQSEFVVDAIQNVIDTAHLRKNQNGTRGLSRSRINGYKGLLRIFKEFQGNKQLRVKEINIKIGKDFFEYLFDECQYSESYALRMIGNLKTVCYDAEISGIEVSPQLKKVESGKPKNDIIIYLSPEELEKIEKVNISPQHLQNARKWLLLGCSIGQRGGDLLSITEDNIVNHNGLEVIEISQMKTGKKVTIPILDKTKEIINKGLPYKISIQKFNQYIKEVCKQAGLNKPTRGKLMDSSINRKKLDLYPKHELISSHVCRRSFASNLYGKLPTPLIMQITGHATEKTFLGYIGKSGIDYAQQIADFYEVQRLKKKKEATLKVVGKISS